MTDQRKKNANWLVTGKDGLARSVEHAQLAVLMDIRDELQSLNSLLRCYRVPKALDALIEVGRDIRRKKRAAAKRRKARK